MHHSASDHSAHDNLATIREWHLARKFKMEGYHFFIRSNGTLELGRPIHMVGAHCRGKNKNSIGICLHGLNKFHAEQFHTAARLIYDIWTIHGKIQIMGHKKVSATDCPNYSVDHIKERLYGMEGIGTSSLERWSESSTHRIRKTNRQ